MKRKLIIIIPVFNEGTTVRTLLERVLASDISGLDLEKKIILVDDGSLDKTPDEIDRFQREHADAPLIRLRLDRNRGKGTAIREALNACDDDSDIVLIQDADLEYEPGDYPALLAPVVRGESPVIYGSRRLGPGRSNASGLIYAIGGTLENLYLKMLFRTRITDIATCYKVMTVGLLKSLDLSCTGFEFCPEVTAKLLRRGVEIREVPIDYHPRKKKDGKKIRWTDLFIALTTLTRVRFTKD